MVPGFVFVSIPPPKGEKYAFSVPVSSIYSILVYPVSQLSGIWHQCMISEEDHRC